MGVGKRSERKRERCRGAREEGRKDRKCKVCLVNQAASQPVRRKDGGERERERVGEGRREGEREKGVPGVREA